MSIELKPCPFCGGEAEIERLGTSRCSTIYQCRNCSCFLETGEEWDHGTDWNTRATDARIAALEEALRRIEAAPLPDQPASAPGDGETWARRHIAHLRDIAARALLDANP